MTEVASLLTSIITYVGNVITALFGAEGAWKDLLPFMLIGIAISLVLLGVKIVRKLTWGA